MFPRCSPQSSLDAIQIGSDFWLAGWRHEDPPTPRIYTNSIPREWAYRKVASARSSRPIWILTGFLLPDAAVFTRFRAHWAEKWGSLPFGRRGGLAGPLSRKRVSRPRSRWQPSLASVGRRLAASRELLRENFRMADHALRIREQ